MEIELIPKSYSVGAVFSFCLMSLSVTASFGMESVLDDPSCRETLSADEANKLRSCMSRSDTCTKYWPNSAADLQDCGKTIVWIRAAMQWPENLQRELFGTTISTAPEPAWKQLKRTEIEGASPQFDLSKAAKANPYSKTTKAITPEAAKAAGFNPSILIGIIQATGQVIQDQAAVKDPEGSAAAKDVLKTVGLEDYAASDQAIQDGRQRAARAEMERQRVAAEQAARVKTAPIPSPPRSVTTTSERPYSTAPTVQTLESPEERKQRAEIERQQALRSMGLPVTSTDDRVASKIGASPVQTTGNSRAGGFVTGAQIYSAPVLRPASPQQIAVSSASPIAAQIDTAVIRPRPMPQVQHEQPPLFEPAVIPTVHSAYGPGRSPRSVFVSEDDQGCPNFVVLTQESGSTDYNNRYGWTVIDYEGSYLDSNGNRITLTSRESVLMGAFDSWKTSPTTLLNSMPASGCKSSSWKVRILQWKDKSGPG